LTHIIEATAGFVESSSGTHDWSDDGGSQPHRLFTHGLDALPERFQTSFGCSQTTNQLRVVSEQLDERSSRSNCL
jgi:hypothetical protein